MNQYNTSGENFLTHTGANNTNFFGGEHHHYAATNQRSATGILHNLRHRGVKDFVGRVEDLQVLRRQMQDGKPGKIIAISGMGGVGKTELALQYAIEHLEQSKPIYTGGIIWLWAREEIGLQILAFARSDNLPPPDNLDLPEQVRWCWRHWRQGEVLLILDDVQNYESIKSFLPVESRFKVLLTTRHTFSSPVQTLKINVLKEDAALYLLRVLVTDGRIAQFADDAKQLCQWLGNLPLGLELVGRYLARKRDLSVQQMLARLEAKRLEAKALLNASQEMTASLGVTAAFELSWQELTEAARGLAAFLSLFALAEIPWWLVQDCLSEWDQEELEDLRDDELVNLHLLQRTGQMRYQLHQLLREFFAAKRQQMSEEDSLKQRFCNGLSALGTVVVNQASTASLSRSLLQEIAPAMPHLKEMFPTLQHYLQSTSLIFTTTAIAQFHKDQADYTEALRWFLYCYEAAVDCLGKKDLGVALALNNLASIFHTMGNYPKAEALFLESFNIRQDQLGDYHPLVAQSLNNLACLYEDQERYQEAEPLLHRALSIWQQCYDNNHPSIGTAQAHLARLCQQQVRMSDATLPDRLSPNILPEDSGSDHVSIATSGNNLALLRDWQKHYPEAEQFYQEALDVKRQHHGDDHPEVATCLNDLAGFYASRGRYTQAKSYYLQALEIQQQKLGNVHPKVAEILDSLVILYASQGQYAEAEPLYLRALYIHRQTLGDNHSQVIEHLNNLVQLYQQEGQTFIDFERRILSGLLRSLAALCASNSLAKNTETLYQRSLEVYKNHYGIDHPETAIDLHNLAFTYQSQGRFEHAERLYLQVLNIWKLNSAHYQTHLANVLHNLGVLCQHQKRYDEAVSYFEQSLSIAEMSLLKPY